MVTLIYNTENMNANWGEIETWNWCQSAFVSSRRIDCYAAPPIWANFGHHLTLPKVKFWNWPTNVCIGLGIFRFSSLEKHDGVKIINGPICKKSFKTFS